MKDSEPLSEDKTAEEILTNTIRAINPQWNYGSDHEDVFRGLWHFFDPPPARQIVLASMEEYASQFKSKDNIPSLSEDRFALKQKFLNDVLGGMSVHDLFEKYLNIPERDSQWIEDMEKAFVAGRSKTSWEQFKKDRGIKAE